MVMLAIYGFVCAISLCACTKKTHLRGIRSNAESTRDVKLGEWDIIRPGGAISRPECAIIGLECGIIRPIPQDVAPAAGIIRGTVLHRAWGEENT